METPQIFTFKQFNGTELFEILSNGNKIVIWFYHASGCKPTRKVYYR